MKEYINKVVHLDWEVGIKNIPDNSIDLVVTDPPYGMSWQSNVRKVKHKKIVGDDNLEWLPNWVEQLKRVVKDDAHSPEYGFSHFKQHHKQQQRQRDFNAITVKEVPQWLTQRDQQPGQGFLCAA